MEIIKNDNSLIDAYTAAYVYIKIFINIYKNSLPVDWKKKKE